MLILPKIFLTDLQRVTRLLIKIFEKINLQIWRLLNFDLFLYQQIKRKFFDLMNKAP